jgi:hypothetical protein
MVFPPASEPSVGVTSELSALLRAFALLPVLNATACMTVGPDALTLLPGVPIVAATSPVIAPL